MDEPLHTLPLTPQQLQMHPVPLPNFQVISFNKKCDLNLQSPCLKWCCFEKKIFQPLACWVYLAPACWHLGVETGVKISKVQPGWKNIAGASSKHLTTIQQSGKYGEKNNKKTQHTKKKRLFLEKTIVFSRDLTSTNPLGLCFCSWSAWRNLFCMLAFGVKFRYGWRHAGTWYLRWTKLQAVVSWVCKQGVNFLQLWYPTSTVDGLENYTLKQQGVPN